MKTDDFEKLHMYLVYPKTGVDSKQSSLSIANCPDDWTTCSIVAATYRNGENVGFTSLMLKKNEVLEVIKALEAVHKDMEYVENTQDAVYDVMYE